MIAVGGYSDEKTVFDDANIIQQHALRWKLYNFYMNNNYKYLKCHKYQYSNMCKLISAEKRRAINLLKSLERFDFGVALPSHVKLSDETVYNYENVIHALYHLPNSQNIVPESSSTGELVPQATSSSTNDGQELVSQSDQGGQNTQVSLSNNIIINEIPESVIQQINFPKLLDTFGQSEIPQVNVHAVKTDNTIQQFKSFLQNLQPKTSLIKIDDDDGDDGNSLNEPKNGNFISRLLSYLKKNPLKQKNSEIPAEYNTANNTQERHQDQPARDQSPGDQPSRDQSPGNQPARDQSSEDQPARDQSDNNHILMFTIGGTSGLILLKILHSLHVHGAFQRLQNWFTLRHQMKKESSKRRFRRMQAIERGLLRGDYEARSTFLRITNPSQKGGPKKSARLLSTIRL